MNEAVRVGSETGFESAVPISAAPKIILGTRASTTAFSRCCGTGAMCCEVGVTHVWLMAPFDLIISADIRRERITLLAVMADIFGVGPNVASGQTVFHANSRATPDFGSLRWLV